MILVTLYSFVQDPATTAIYTLSLHDALPIFTAQGGPPRTRTPASAAPFPPMSPVAKLVPAPAPGVSRSEEHTSELQSHSDLVCRLLLEKKNSNHVVLTAIIHTDLSLSPLHLL